MPGIGLYPALRAAAHVLALHLARTLYVFSVLRNMVQNPVKTIPSTSTQASSCPTLMNGIVIVLSVLVRPLGFEPR